MKSNKTNKKDIQETKKLWRKIRKKDKQPKLAGDADRKYRIVQSVKAGHIRGGHKFH